MVVFSVPGVKNNFKILRSKTSVRGTISSSDAPTPGANLMATLQRGGWLAIFRTLAPPPMDSDADLLHRFVHERSEAALDVLVRRYAGMVMGVCRRRLGESPDADDAFQATFLVLAKSAGSVSRGTSLPAWLHRVAYLTSLKLAGRLHRRGMTPMETEPVDPSPVAAHSVSERNELKSVIDEELAALPEKFRSTVVLCCLEGKTNSEAAQVLGIPVGTVDSRLHTAKDKLRDRLTKRGVAGAAVALTLPAGDGASDELIQTTVRAAMAYAVGNEIASPLITTLAKEVSTNMTAFKFKMLAAATMIVTLAGGVGTGMYFANAGDDPKAQVSKAKPETKKPETAPKTNDPVASITESSAVGTTATTTSVLNKSAGFNGPINMQIGELFEHLSKEHNATFRIENLNALKTMGIDNPYERNVDIRFTRGLSVQDILDEVVHTFSIPADQKWGFRVKGNQVIFGPVFTPPTVPGAFATGEVGTTQIPVTDIYKMLYGPTVSLSVKDKSLIEIVEILREQTGSNIVLNTTNASNADKKITLTLNDTKLFTVLKVASDVCNLAPAVVDNVFYITEVESAQTMNRETSRALFGDVQNTTNVMVPVDKDGKFVPNGLRGLNQGLGGGGGPTLVPVRVDDGEKTKPKTADKK